MGLWSTGEARTYTHIHIKHAMLLPQSTFNLALSQSSLFDGQLEGPDKIVGENLFVLVIDLDLELGIFRHLIGDRWFIR